MSRIDHRLQGRMRRGGGDGHGWLDPGRRGEKLWPGQTVDSAGTTQAWFYHPD